MKLRTAIKIGFLFFVFCFVFFFIWPYYWQFLLADHYYLEVRRAMRDKNYVALFENYQKVFNLQPRETYYRQNYVNDLLLISDKTSFLTDEHKIKIFEIAIQNIEAIPKNERIFNLDGLRVVLLNRAAELTKDEEDFEKAETAMRAVIQQSPRMAQGYSTWCQLKIYQKNWQEALKQCQQALSLYPDMNHPDMNSDHRNIIISEMITVYEKIGQIYFGMEDYSQSRQAYLTTIKFIPLRYDLYKKIADTYYMEGDLDTAIQYNLHGMTMGPEDATWPLAIGLLYQEKGDLNKARQYGQKALELAPESEQIKNFVQNLDSPAGEE